MNFNDCYRYMERLISARDFSNIGQDFTAMIYLTGKDSGYIYMSYISGVKSIEPIKHNSANIYITMSIGTFEKISTGQLDALRAFTTKQIQAKGNAVLAMTLFNSLK